MITEREGKYSYLDYTGQRRDFDPQDGDIVVTIDPANADKLDAYVKKNYSKLSVKEINNETGFARIEINPSQNTDDSISSLTTPSGTIITGASPPVKEYETNDHESTRYFLPYRLLVTIKKNNDPKKVFEKYKLREVHQYSEGYFSVSFESTEGFSELDALFEKLNELGSTAESVAQSENKSIHESSFEFETYAPQEVGFKASLSQMNPNDSRYSQQWGLKSTVNRIRDVKAPEAWFLSTGHASAVVAVLDTGIDIDHPDFNGKIVDWYDAVNNLDRPANPVNVVNDTNGHGTKVCGVIGARTQTGAPNAGVGIAGMGWDCTLFPIRIGANLDTLDYAKVVAAIDKVVSRAQTNSATTRYVMNMSWKADGDHEDVRTRIQTAYNEGVVIVAAAADDGKDIGNLPVNYPAAYTDWVIPVGAHDNVDSCDKLSSPPTNWGPSVVIAPGKSIQTTLFNGSWGPESGSSVAAAFVSGTAGLCLAKHRSLHGGAYVDTRQVLRGKVYDCILLHLRTWNNPGASFKGRLDACAAVSFMT